MEPHCPGMNGDTGTCTRCRKQEQSRTILKLTLEALERRQDGK